MWEAPSGRGAQVKQGLLRGVAECVLKDNKLVYVDVQGYQDVEHRSPMTGRSLIRCYSITKPITAFALLALWEENKVSLDDPVSKYIPEFERMQVVCKKHNPKRACRPITLRHLVTHTSGIGYGPSRKDRTYRLSPCTDPDKERYHDFVKKVDSGAMPDLETWCKELAKLPLLFQPGERYEYSYGMDVIGRVIEVVSGMPLDKFLRQRVLHPIGMRDTAFYLTPQRAARQLCGNYAINAKGGKTMFYSVRCDGKVPQHSSWVHGQSRGGRILSGGGFISSCDGGLVSSLRDIALFASVVANHGFAHATRQQVLRPATVRAGCRSWLRLKSVTKCSSLRGWHDHDGYEALGWAPLGITEGDNIFMGGLGSWSVNLRTKTVIVSAPNSYWHNFTTIKNWKEEVDELEGAVKKAAEDFSIANPNKRKRPCAAGDSAKRRRGE
jgi:CubicO group peptidase (beta-lactamase class C family)